MNTLILTHRHTDTPLALDAARGVATRAQAAGHAVLLLVSDAGMANQHSGVDMVQNTLLPDEFSYASIRQSDNDYMEGNLVFVTELLPKLLDWFQPVNIHVIDPAAVGWNVLRSLRHACPQASLVGRLVSDLGMASNVSPEDALIRSALLGGALGLFNTLYAQTPGIRSLLEGYRSHLQCEPQQVESAP